MFLPQTRPLKIIKDKIIPTKERKNKMVFLEMKYIIIETVRVRQQIPHHWIRNLCHPWNCVTHICCGSVIDRWPQVLCFCLLVHAEAMLPTAWSQPMAECIRDTKADLVLGDSGLLMSDFVPRLPTDLAKTFLGSSRHCLPNTPSPPSQESDLHGSQAPYFLQLPPFFSSPSFPSINLL